ncbi:MAG: ribbon-helix-helix domain-containing protein [Candidatus Methanofastidiosa archaeon]|nr:ribbon-helix-helix domain-containing protein [Candidatus Methanofastidiosa archaeon]
MEDKVIATTYISNETYQKIRSLSKETGIKVSALYEKLIHIGLKNFKGELK